MKFQAIGATDYLLQCCWAPRTVNFEAHLVYPTNPNARQSEALAFGLRVLVDRLEVLEEVRLLQPVHWMPLT